MYTTHHYPGVMGNRNIGDSPAPDLTMFPTIPLVRPRLPKAAMDQK